jgi:integrase
MDFARGLIYVRQTKTNRDRFVPMNDVVRQMLERQTKTSGYVFPSPKTGRRMIDLKRSFRDALEVAKIQDFRFHDLRHITATRLADAGENVVVIAEDSRPRRHRDYKALLARDGRIQTRGGRTVG